MDNSQYERSLWQRFKAQPNDEVTNELIQYYIHIVDYQVERIAQHIPASFDRADLKSLGLMGLHDALYKFDLSRNIKFITYASIRVHGSIIDGLRREDWLPRALRDKANKIERTSTQLEQRFNRIPTAEDIAKELQMTVAEVEAAISDTLFAKIQSLDAKFQTDSTDESTNALSFIEDDQSVTPEGHVLLGEMKTELVQSIKQLKQNEQMVISLVYMEELSLTEVGEILELTTSRISQIHKTAIFKLRKILEKAQHS